MYRYNLFFQEYPCNLFLMQINFGPSQLHWGKQTKATYLYIVPA